jgi:DNA-binding NarL/FixJ family response regulator
MNGPQRPSPPGRRSDDIRVLLVDDHALFREGLRSLLEEYGVQIVGEAATGEGATRQVADLLPDVVVMDLNMPGMGGVEATRRLTTLAPVTRVLVLTVSAEQDDMVDAVMAGACGYLLKDASAEEIVRGIAAAAAGESLISPRIAAKLLARLREEEAPPKAEADVRAELSEREREVLRLVAAGLSNEEIAAQLVISPKTVKKHVANLLTKLQLENRVQAAGYAIRTGIVA